MNRKRIAAALFAKEYTRCITAYYSGETGGT
jgi:hypothetical protein